MADGILLAYISVDGDLQGGLVLRGHRPVDVTGEEEVVRCCR